MSGAEYTFQLNIKLGSGYDAHLLNITGVAPTDFKENLEWCTANAAGIVSTAAALEGAYGAKNLAPNVTSTQVTNEAPGQWTGGTFAQPQQQPQQHYAQAAAQPYQQQQPYQNQQPQQQQGGGAPAPSCRHGAMKLVPGGISKSSGKSYNSFWACTADRDQQCKSQNS